MITLAERPFYSVQGEGRNIGKPSMFLRFFGCNLNCSWCDSKFAWKPEFRAKYAKAYELEDLISLIKEECKSKHVIFTGGEPTLFEFQISEIQSALPGFTFEIETNGSNVLKNHYDQVNVSYKLASSGVSRYELKALHDDYDYKFVISNDDDKKLVQEVVTEKGLKNVYIMPEGVSPQSQKNIQLVEFCKENGYRFTMRLHVMLWGAIMGV